MKKIRISILILLAIVGLSACQECVDVEVPYTERIPYQAEESYFEEAEYNVVDSRHWKKYDCERENFWGDCTEKKWFLEGETTLENLESVPVEFTVIKHFETYYAGKFELKKTIKIPAFGTRKFRVKHYLTSESENYKKPSYSIRAGTVEKLKTVTKYNEITKYRQCNTCVEECGSMYEDDSFLEEIPWWGYLIGGLFLLRLIFS